MESTTLSPNQGEAQARRLRQSRLLAQEAPHLCSSSALAQASRLCFVYMEQTARLFAKQTGLRQQNECPLAQASRLCLIERLQLANKIILSIFIFFFLGLNYSHGQISSSSYHLVRNDLQNSFAKFNKNKKGRVAFLGGSITYNPGWRDSISNYIQKRFPGTAFEFIAAGIPSMGSTPGAFRLERDILSRGKIDLLFVEAAVNDPTNGRSSTEQIRGMEGIIRHAKSTNPRIDIVTMYFVDPDKMKDYNNGSIPEVIENHEKVAKHYNITGINLAKEVTDRINAHEFSWEDDFINLHPSPFGQNIYFHSIKNLLLTVWDKNPKGKVQTYPKPNALDKSSYDKGKLIPITKAKIADGWHIDSFWRPKEKAGTRKGYVNVPMLISEKPSATITLKFKGKAIGIAVAAGPDAGMIEYSIDGGEFKQLDLFTEWSSGLHLPWYYLLEAELTPTKHTLSMRIIHDKNQDSKGNACRIKHFFINGN